MNFNLQVYIEKLRLDKEKKEIIQNYEKHYGKIVGGIHDQIWFIDYVSKFLPYYEAVKSPMQLEDLFDWKLFFALSMSSFASLVELEKPDKILRDPLDKIDLVITATTENESKTKKLSELDEFVIIRLFEIYCEQEIVMQTLIAQSGREMVGIYNERLKKLDYIQNYNPLFKRLNPEKKEQPINQIYHYTSLNTINEILKSNSLRACDLRRLNDKKEHKIWFEVFDQVVSKFLSKKDFDSYNEFLKMITSKIEDYKKIDCYVTCFSLERDLLSQWRAYGDDGQGICIGFDKTELLNDMYLNNDPKNEFKLLNGFLEYNYEVIHNDLYDIIQLLIRDFLSSSLELEEYFNRVDKNEFFKNKCRSIYTRMQDLKDGSFYEEKEYRMFYQIRRFKPDKTINTFERNKRLIPYVSLDFGEKNIPIKEIIIGPALSDKEEVKENISEVLIHYGYDPKTIKITISDLPYRK